MVPAAHYATGGVWVDEWGRASIQDLYALGEVLLVMVGILLALGMIGGLAGMTAYARRQIPATEMLSSVQEMTTAPEATFPANPESEA